MSNNLLIIPGDIVKETLSMVQAIDLMRDAFSELSAGNITIPDRIHLDMPLDSADSLIMPVYSVTTGKYGVKVVSLNRDNYKNHLPMIHAVMLLFDSINGKPVALVDAESITSIRTGAASGLATDLLSRTDSSVVAIFGSGVQARTQLEAVCSVRNIKQALVFTKDVDSIDNFINEMNDKLSIIISYEEDLSRLYDADIICTATNSAAPLFEDEHIQDGVHINAIGSYKPNEREIPSKTVARAKTVVDSRKSCLLESGDIIIPINESLINEDHIEAELGEIISGNKKCRLNNSDITLFKTVGSAIQDLVCAIYVYENARKEGLGQFVQL